MPHRSSSSSADRIASASSSTDSGSSEGADPLPTTAAEVEARYGELFAEHQRRSDGIARRQRLALALFAAVSIVTTIAAGSALRHVLPGWAFLALFALVAATLSYAIHQGSLYSTEGRLLELYRRALARADGSKVQSGRTGLEADLRPAQHLYERDLDILGEDSLFGVLATTRTGLGERGLARYLLLPAEYAETIARQQAVQELRPQRALRERIALLGTSSVQQLSASFFDGWLDEPVASFSPALRPLLGVTALLNGAMLVLGLAHLRPWGELMPYLALTLLLQTGLCLILRARVMPLLAAGKALQGNVALLTEGLALLQRSHFTAAKLQKLQQSAREPAGAVEALRRLRDILGIIEQRGQGYFLPISLLLAAGTQAAISLADWKRTYVAPMRVWLELWGEFEALNALATYAFEHPEDAWPELLPITGPSVYAAEALAHPLLAGATANDIRFDRGTRFLLISGSNMSGKSTLLRAIGVNAVLAYAGAPVRARSLRLSPLVLGAALSLTDSLAEGRSKFRAEVERLSAIVKQSGELPVLFLVDEIFSGTNSADRRTAAAAVLERLLQNHAIGALSTHDLALTELATELNGGLNVHMASPDPDDPLCFDYRLKPGINQTSNALAIVRLLGL